MNFREVMSTKSDDTDFKSLEQEQNGQMDVCTCSGRLPKCANPDAAVLLELRSNSAALGTQV